MSAPEPERSPQPHHPTVAELLVDLTWEDLTSDGVITLDQIDAELRAKGLDPNKYDYLYEE
ncbi:MAG: hypothetical protein LT071_14505 [Nocardioides sp.]|nr:hypothetical protein [Nocardioides sp.]